MQAQTVQTQTALTQTVQAHTREAHTPLVLSHSPEAVLDFEHLSGGFRSGRDVLPVLNDVSFSVARGAITALVGATGSGKTLLALCTLGLAPRQFVTTAGSIHFDGLDLVQLDQRGFRALRGKRIVIVFQDARAALNPVFTVGNQIADACRLHRGVGKKEALVAAEQMLDRLRVPQAARRMRQYPHELSGGMAQRAQLAMALVCDPSLLILDEPTTGLDVTIQADIMDLIVDLNRVDRMSTLLITHDLAVVAETCDEVVVLQSGEVREIGSCEQVLSNPQTPYTQGLIADSRLEGLRG
ncbi:MAG: ABC transporter ATP-binding protein [Acidimicrobiales bacterium]